MHFLLLVIERDTPLKELVGYYSENREVEPYCIRSPAEVADEVISMLPFKNVPNNDGDGTDMPTAEERKFSEFLTRKDVDFSALPMEILQKIATEYLDMKLDAEGYEISTYNSDAQFDYYTIGGCWGSYLKLKNSDETYASARAKDVDLERTIKENGEPFAYITPDGIYHTTENADENILDVDIHPDDILTVLDCHM